MRRYVVKMPKPSQLRTITLSPKPIIHARRYKVKMPKPSQLPEIPPWKSMKDVLRKAGHRQEARQKAKGGGKTKGTVVVMRGLPGSGKSTFVSRVFGPSVKVIRRLNIPPCGEE
jgi:predicted ATP-dependent serine protease